MGYPPLFARVVGKAIRSLWNGGPMVGWVALEIRPVTPGRKHPTEPKTTPLSTRQYRCLMSCTPTSTALFLRRTSVLVGGPMLWCFRAAGLLKSQKPEEGFRTPWPTLRPTVLRELEASVLGASWKVLGLLGAQQPRKCSVGEPTYLPAAVAWHRRAGLAPFAVSAVGTAKLPTRVSEHCFFSLPIPRRIAPSPVPGSG